MCVLLHHIVIRQPCGPKKDRFALVSRLLSSSVADGLSDVTSSLKSWEAVMSSDEVLLLFLFRLVAARQYPK